MVQIYRPHKDQLLHKIIFIKKENYRDKKIILICIVLHTEKNAWHNKSIETKRIVQKTKNLSSIVIPATVPLQIRERELNGEWVFQHHKKDKKIATLP